MRDLHLLIKPASSTCNMRCRYCFYMDEASKRETDSYGMMDEKVMEMVIKKAFQAVERTCTFGFQGGEPTLAGLEFFETFIRLVKQYNTKKIVVKYSLQTNGLLLDDRWMDFLEKHRFLVGISLDGPKEIQDQNRVDINKKSTFLTVTRTIAAMQKRKIEFNVLTVLTGQSARHIEKIYRFLKKTGVYYHQYIPCMDPFDNERGGERYSLTANQLGDAWKCLFDLWYLDWMNGTYVSVRQFENWVGMLRGYPPEACAMYGICSMQNVIEANGDIFPCDFYALDSYCMGNIMTEDLEELHDRSIRGLGFFKDAKKRGDQCSLCKWYPLCRGGCKRDYEYMPDGSYSNYFCQAYKEFFPYAIERLEQITALTERVRG